MCLRSPSRLLLRHVSRVTTQCTSLIAFRNANGEIAELDKARGNTKSGFGGAIFGGSTSLPSELSSLAAPQQSVSKLLLSTKTAVGSANHDYDKLMGLSATPPSAPVYAARLNGLLKSLANAEGAVEQCVKARKTLVNELQKILDTNKAALAADEEQLEKLKQRKTEVDDKKRDVELAIMQGLSDTDSPGPNKAQDQPVPEPEMPEVEALTPPSAGPEDTEDSHDETQWSSEVPPDATLPPTQNATQGIELLSSLASHYSSMPTTMNGSKKRRLDSGDEFPDLGGDDGIDADVAEILRKDSTGGA
jgi:regulator of Ty1 transposition protein 103